MMHACESGLIKYVNKIFVASMSLSVQVQVDLLIEKTFVGNRQSGKYRLSRTNFCGGACSLTMLSSHHWPGMTTAFLVLLLTEEGKEACKDCFAFQDGEDAPEHAMNWDAGRGERLLKPFFKDTAVTCQQRNTDVFVTQLAARAQEKLVLAKAILSTSKKANYEAVIGTRRDLHEEQTRPVSYSFLSSWDLLLHSTT
jgi:hypothetical protein